MCDPPCQNKGACDYPGHCTCTSQWKGERCEERKSLCGYTTTRALCIGQEHNTHFHSHSSLQPAVWEWWKLYSSATVHLPSRVDWWSVSNTYVKQWLAWPSDLFMTALDSQYSNLFTNMQKWRDMCTSWSLFMLCRALERTYMWNRLKKCLHCSYFEIWNPCTICHSLLDYCPQISCLL